MIDFFLRPFRRNFGKDKHFYAAIDDMFGFIPHNIELYKLALIHKSASVVLEDGSHINNERLEFLGDAVLESVSSDYLFIEFPDKNEGFLTQLRSKMVSRQTLNEVAKRIGLDDYVITHSSNNLSQKHIYGDAFEAMMGAIYLDQGYDFVNRLLINRIFVDYIKVDTLLVSETDFKSRLIEWCQKNHHTIHFATSHDKTYSTTHPFFYSKVLIDNMEVGYGAGDSKKEAEQRAAHSVSQGFSDDDCAKLLDKLDNIDSAHKPHQPNPSRKEPKEPKESKSAKEHQTPKESQSPKGLKEEKPAKKAVVKSEEKPAEKPIVKPAEKPVEKTEKTPVEKPATEQTKQEPKAADVVVDMVGGNVEHSDEPKATQKRTARKPAAKRTPRNSQPKAAEPQDANSELKPSKEPLKEPKEVKKPKSSSADKRPKAPKTSDESKAPTRKSDSPKKTKQNDQQELFE